MATILFQSQCVNIDVLFQLKAIIIDDQLTVKYEGAVKFDEDLPEFRWMDK